MSQQLRNNVSTVLLLASLFLLLAATAPAQVTAVVTADNAYGFGYGTKKEILTGQYYGGIENLKAADITSCATGPETYNINPAITDYLYIIAWSDDAVYQGVLGHFKNGTKVLRTGSSNWEVFATGVDFDINTGSKGPSLAQINAQIALANAGAGDKYASSIYWRKLSTNGPSLALGEPNDKAGGTFTQVCGIDAEARWMWFNVDPSKYNAFTENPLSGGGHKEFLIFRIPAKDVVTAADFDATTVCQGAATSFTNVVTSGAVTSWDWDLGDGTKATDQTVTHTYAKAGTYNVTLCINGGTSCITKPVTVNPLPPVLAVHGATTKCNLSTSYSVKDMGYQYSWSVSNGTIISPTNGSSITVKWPPSGASIVTVTITSTSGCSTTSSLLVTPCTATITTTTGGGINN